jgi:hypothetical protein
LNIYYLVDRKERLLNSFVVTGRAYVNQFNGIGLSIFNRISQLSKYESLHGTN